MLSLCCLVVGDPPPQPTQLCAESLPEWEGEGDVKVMLTMDCGFATEVCYRGVVVMWAYLGGIIRAVLSWDPYLHVHGLSEW